MIQKTAKIFWNGRSQAVRLPKEFRFAEKEVFIRREGNQVILTPKPQSWRAFFEDILNTFESVGSDSLCISVITQAELQYGVEKSSNPARNQAILDELTQDGEWDDLAGGNFGEWI